MSQRPIVFELNPLPDFLKGHTLSSEGSAPRMKEVLAQWVQFVGSLWSWKDAATFALRYMSRRGVTRIWLLAVSHDPSRSGLLADDLAVLCRSHGLPAHRVKDESVLNLPGGPLVCWDDAAIVMVRQFETNQLWSLPKERIHLPEYAVLKKYHDSDLTCQVPYPWWAPGGPFLLPLEKMISQPVPTGMTVYLQPTEMTGLELNYLSTVAKAAQSTSDQHRQALGQAMGTRFSDPIAGLVGRIFVANLRRLSDKPFLVSVHCVASANRVDSARSLAGSLESVLYEPPFDLDQSHQEDNRLPSAAAVISPTPENGMMPEFLRQYAELRFSEVSQDNPTPRFSRLVDARGAATVFRLPINVAGGVPGVAVQQNPPDFHPGPRINTVDPVSEIDLGCLHQGGHAKITRSALCKHALVTGFTGSGKTETVLGLIHQIHEGGTPVLVIESAKREYRGLLGVPAFAKCEKPLWIFSVGNETCAPFRLNPFELLPGIRVEQHISRLQTCIEAALPPIGPLASMIGEAIVNIYEERGWRLTDTAPDVGEPMLLSFPEMSDFARRMSEIPKERNYQDEVLSNVTAAVTGRIKPLTIGGKGLIFRPERRYRPGELREESAITRIFNRSTVLELEELNLEDKALFVMIVLSFLREYRDSHPSKDGSLSHVTVVEEAHNVLENVASNGTSEECTSGDSRYKAVQAFSLMLSEIRALGEGLIIVDQSPEKLAPDAMRNTNLHIAHQLRDSTDREAIARAMIMDEEQRDYLGKLAPGNAALFMTGLQKATFVNVPRYRPPLSRSGKALGDKPYPGIGFRVADNRTVRRYMDGVTRPYRTGPFDLACECCPGHVDCRWRAGILAAMVDSTCFDEYVHLCRSYESSLTSAEEFRRRLVSIAVRLAEAAFPKPDESQVWCAFVHLWHRRPKNRRADFDDDYHKVLLPIIRRTIAQTDS